jgi:single-strand DNA-binding protein
MNSVSLIARVVQIPSLRTTPGGTNVTTLRVAVPRPRKDGEEQGADFVDVVCFGRQAETCVEYLTKGRRVAIIGRLSQSEWTAEDGSRRSKLEVIANTVDFLDRPATSNGDEAAIEAAAVQ